ncbi:MAG: hypothetical protein Q9225_006698 [Loekoesia sp. 1 TL-2023]
MSPSHSSDPQEVSQPGPHPSYIQIAKPYIFESKIQECLLLAGVTETRDDSIRLQAVAWIDSDAAAAALFAACKIEDTLKKSRDILCAAHNLKLPAAEQLTPDDSIFENHAKIIIGVERLMLEASGFDFRNRYPQRLLFKIAKIYGVDKETVGKTAYNMSLDLYRTFAPLKQTTPTMAIACVELAGRILDKPIPEIEAGNDYEKWKTTRQEIMETLLDLLDLYTHHRASTMVGQDHALDKFISIRIALNQEASAENLPRFTQSERRKALTNGTTSNGVKEERDSKGITSPHDIVSPKDIKSPQPMGLTSVTGTPVQGKPGLKDGTVRFMLDPDRARDEKHTVAEFFKMDEEEYEVEVENDRRRDSAASMALPAEQESEDNSQPMDLEQIQDHGICESEYGSRTGQENYDKFVPEEEKVDSLSSTSSRKSKAPLTEQNAAFQAAVPQFQDTIPSIRGGGSGYCLGQENDYKSVVDGENTKLQPQTLSRKTKVPLAEQGVAFQAALQQSREAVPSSRGSHLKERKWNKAMREEAAAAVAESPRLAALKAQKTREKKAGKKERKRQQMCEMEVAE